MSKAFSLWEFIQKPIPLGVLALILGLLGVSYYTPLLVVCEAVLIFDFYKYGISKDKKWAWREYLAFVLVTSAVLGITDYLLARSDQHSVANTPPTDMKLSCIVETVQFEPAYRFYQFPPVYYQKLDTWLRVNLTNQTGKRLYIRGHDVRALVGVGWVKFKNADTGAFEPYGFGGMQKDYLVRFDLSQNGFDYVMQQRPLNTDENSELWMFFISGLSRADQRNINQFKFVFYDSGGIEFPCVSDYSIKTDQGTVVGSSQLKFLPREPIPSDLREEPPH